MRYKLMVVTVLVAILSTLAFPAGVTLAAQNNKLLKSIKVTGNLIDDGNDVGDFKGKVTITSVGYDETEGFVVSGVLKGTATDSNGVETEVNQSFANVPATLGSDQTRASSGLDFGFVASAQAQAQCQILFLDIGPIFLDVLGLQVDLSEIILDITAVGGAGNLLGNLLCAVAGLLDPNTGLLIGLLEDLLDLLNQINNLLG